MNTMNQKIYFLVFGVLLLSKTWAATPPKDQLTLYMQNKKGAAAIRLGTMNGAYFDQSCLDKVQKKKLCRAYGAYSGSYVNKSTRSFTADVPSAAQSCERSGGRAITLIDTRGNQYAYCGFNDGSLVDSWALEKKIRSP